MIDWNLIGTIIGWPAMVIPALTLCYNIFQAVIGLIDDEEVGVNIWAVLGLILWSTVGASLIWGITGA